MFVTGKVIVKRRESVSLRKKVLDGKLKARASGESKGKRRQSNAWRCVLLMVLKISSPCW